MIAPRLRRLASLVALAALLPAPAHAWGRTGHRVIGQIAEAHLAPAARARVRAILGVETLAEASTWPDFMRSAPEQFWQKEATPWHYVTVPVGRRYAEVGAPPEGDAATALAHYGAVLRDPRSTRAARQEALRLVVHLVGDLHQPLHAGKPGDRGGNDVKVTFFGRETNLHAVWDSALVDDEQLSFSEMATWLDARITPALAEAWSDPDPATWIAESTALRDLVYPADPALSYAYVYQNKARMEERLEQGGIRLAAYLNRLFPAARRAPRRARR